MEKEIFITVFTPTYNRESLLARLYDSIKRQDFSNFEWIIVDDGSTDNTSSIVEAWAKESNFDIRYFYQENSGKHIAINKGVDNARGELFFIVDSDDWLSDNVLQDIWQVWQSIPKDQRILLAGVSGLCAYRDGSIVGTKYPLDSMDSDHIEIRTFYDVKGDKAEVFRTDILREFPFPSNLGKFVPEGLIWNRIGQKYKMRYVNKIWRYIEYQPDGLTSKSIELRVENLSSVILYYEECIKLKNKRIKFRYRVRNTINYVRFSIHRGEFFKNLVNISDIRLKLLYLIVSPFSFLLYLRDRFILKGRG
ncbi:MAG: glycosyltransferase family 2 protein [Candidatus Omnitrophica bacterium]|nr:glycosyltransferase family 2 protein [Candidatus Omnitrophota bacterium]